MSIASSAVTRVELTRVGYTAIIEEVAALCTTPTFTYSRWRLRDFGRHSEDIAPDLFRNTCYFIAVIDIRRGLLETKPSRYIYSRTDCTGMRRIMTFRSTTYRIYDGVPIRL